MQPADGERERVGERLGEKCVRRKKHLRDPSGKRFPPFMREISVFYFSTVMTLSVIVVKPPLNMLLLPVPLLPFI